MSPAVNATLPATFRQAAFRGIRCLCPRCGQARLFRKWLKPMGACSNCGIDWSPQRADDFPAYIAIIVSGHLLAPLVIILSKDFDLGPAAMFSIIIPLALGMMLGTLQPSKGAVIAAQWWFGMHGFRQERPAESCEPADNAEADIT